MALFVLSFHLYLLQNGQIDDHTFRHQVRKRRDNAVDLLLFTKARYRVDVAHVDREPDISSGFRLAAFVTVARYDVDTAALRVLDQLDELVHRPENQ